jgi:hypothetical protein
MPPRGTPANLALGPGYLYYAQIGTPEVTDLITAWATVSVNWIPLGYTDQGSQFNYQLNTDPVDVAEELDPISNAPTGRASSVSFALAEITATNLKRVSNGGTIVTGAGIATFEPPDLGTEVRSMLGFESEDHSERWVFRQCFMSGQLQMQRQKGASNTTMAAEYSLEKPASGARLYKAIFSTTTPNRS